MLDCTIYTMRTIIVANRYSPKEGIQMGISAVGDSAYTSVIKPVVNCVKAGEKAFKESFQGITAPVDPKKEVEHLKARLNIVYTKIDDQSGMEVVDSSESLEEEAKKETIKKNAPAQVSKIPLWTRLKNAFRQPAPSTPKTGPKRSIKLEKGKDLPSGLTGNQYQYNKENGKLTIWGKMSPNDCELLKGTYSSTAEKEKLDALQGKSQKDKLSFSEKAKNIWGKITDMMDLSTISGLRRSVASFLTGIAFAPVAFWNFGSHVIEEIAKINFPDFKDISDGLLAWLSPKLFEKEKIQESHTIVASTKKE